MKVWMNFEVGSVTDAETGQRKISTEIYSMASPY